MYWLNLKKVLSKSVSMRKYLPPYYCATDAFTSSSEYELNFLAVSNDSFLQMVRKEVFKSGQMVFSWTFHSEHKSNGKSFYHLRKSLKTSCNISN